MSNTDRTTFATIPMRKVGPVRITGPVMEGEVLLPLATYETPLWPSVARGAKVSVACGGLRAVVVDERMTRSVLVEAPTAEGALAAWQSARARREEMHAVVASTSRFARLLDLHAQIAGSMLYVRFELSTGDAAGHNMATKAAEALQSWLLKEYPALRYITISGNYCTDKKVSAVNGILGRGKSVVTEMVIARDLCQRLLKATPEKIAEVNLKKNLIGTMLAGGLRTANAHYANMLLAFYLATGQDAANIVEGSQGIVHAEVRGDALYFSANVPNVIVGTVGNGKEQPFVEDNLRQLGCLEARNPGENARRLAVIAAAAVCCGELSLLAAQTNPGELMRAHLSMERRGT